MPRIECCPDVVFPELLEARLLIPGDFSDDPPLLLAVVPLTWDWLGWGRYAFAIPRGNSHVHMNLTCAGPAPDQFGLHFSLHGRDYASGFLKPVSTTADPPCWEFAIDVPGQSLARLEPTLPLQIVITAASGQTVNPEEPYPWPLYGAVSGWASDSSGGWSSDSVNVNEPPVAIISVTDDGAGGWIIDPYQSYDPENQSISFQWTLNGVQLPSTEIELHFTQEDLVLMREFVGMSIPLQLAVTDGVNAAVANAMIAFSDDEGNPTPPLGAAPTIWDDWTSAQDYLDVSGTGDAARVRKVIAALDGKYALTNIPDLNSANGAVPGRAVHLDFSARSHVFVNTVEYVGGIARDVVLEYEQPIPLLTTAQLARINIRTNLQSIKSQLVHQITAMMDGSPPISVTSANPGTGTTTAITLDATQRDWAAQTLADMYIRAVDDYLVAYPLARPKVSAVPGGFTRLFNYLVRTEAQRNQAYPWCVVCADFIYAKMIEGEGAVGNIPGTNARFDQIFNIKRVAWDKSAYNVDFGADIQHNWVAIYVVSYQNMETFSTTQLDGKPVLWFDPWHDLKPSVYHSEDKNYKLTNWNAAAP